MNQLTEASIELLQNLIRTPSFSKEEAETGDLIQSFLEDQGIPTNRHVNNIWATNKHFDPDKPTLLLNSHHDTVKPNSGYTNDPFEPLVDEGKLYGLGANDAGGALTSLLATFIHFYNLSNLDYNLVMAATGEEEISGANGISSILEKIPEIDCAIVGEPTQMRMAVAEKGLIVLRCRTKGKSGHAARDEGMNAIYPAMHDIQWFENYSFAKISETLGPVKMTVTVVHAGEQHNVVPDSCDFTVDIRSTDAYTNEEILNIVTDHITSKIVSHSIRLKPSFMPLDHPIVEAGNELNLEQYGSPTLSDQAFLTIPSLKMGPGKSARSHTADEFIYLEEIRHGIHTYIKLLNKIL